MSEGYLSKKREAQLAKMLDGAIDFNKLFPNRKFLGIVSVGNFLERKDRKLFEMLISVLDDKVIGKTPNPETVDLIEKAISLLETQNFPDFSVFAAELLSDKINTPFEAYEKQLFTSVIMMFNALLMKVVERAYQMTEKADDEDERNNLTI